MDACQGKTATTCEPDVTVDDDENDEPLWQEWAATSDGDIKADTFHLHKGHLLRE
ncbi:hypothetical protein [Alloactinosynnema sp. L-07]|nr:hypothetical protein [Alloactinosynnema sp. L-07]